ncbi:GIY-YIG nuclease family protein [Methyloceanibacter sp.]|uniref:GIY-YIG nuclease family protein n=1 Tax=Methyloceanibacter sp. TaxID=1965321 RepID=UPI003D6DA21A
MTQGFVYVLTSSNSNYIKIGGTENPISQRLRAINGTLAYADHGPWELSDFLHVTDWRLVEGGLHRHFREHQVLDAEGTRELFDVRPHEARQRLRLTDDTLRVGHQKTAAIFKNEDVKMFLFKLFQLTGLFGCVDIQGAWSLSILPSTAGGRWFTLNVGSHEVAFSTRHAEEGKYWHCLVLDRLILEYPNTILWFGKRKGEVEDAPYASAKERAVTVEFQADFAEAESALKLPGMRRALIAYWSERLADLRERNAKSVFARSHAYDAVSQLLEYKRDTQKLVHGE